MVCEHIYPFLRALQLLYSPVKLSTLPRVPEQVSIFTVFRMRLSWLMATGPLFEQILALFRMTIEFYQRLEMRDKKDYSLGFSNCEIAPYRFRRNNRHNRTQSRISLSLDLGHFSR